MSSLLSLAPYHVIVFSSLLGSTLYETFVMSKVCFLYLPRSAFTSLNKKLFPIFFRIQCGLVLLSALTHPPFSLLSLFQKPGDLIPLALAGLTSTLNLVVYEPQTKRTMIERTHQETIDGRKFDDKDVSPDMVKKKRAFSREHAMCIHLNLISVVAILWYGMRLGGRISVG